MNDLLLPQVVIHSPLSPAMCCVTSTHLPFRVYSTLIAGTFSVVYTTFANSQEVHSLMKTIYANHNRYSLLPRAHRVTTLAISDTRTLKSVPARPASAIPWPAPLAARSYLVRMVKSPGEHAVIYSVISWWYTVPEWVQASRAEVVLHNFIVTL